jgi:hypothetical protein
MNNQSEEITELAAALCKAQGSIQGASKDSVNPHFKSKYADLASCWDACRSHLSDNGLSIVQIPIVDKDRAGVTTILMHSSGQWIKGDLLMQIAVRALKDRQGNPLPKGDPDPQTTGSCITYARRYALAAFVGIAPEDDDGNAASSRAESRVHNTPAPEITQPMLQRLYTLQSRSAWDVTKLKAIMLEKYAVNSSKELNRKQYDEVCEALLANPKPKETKTVEQLKEDGDIKPASEV